MPDTLSGESLELQATLADPNLRILVHLAKNAIDWSVARPALGDLLECDFVGYAPKALSDWEVFQGEDVGMGEALTAPVTFESGYLLAPQLATCVYATIAHGDDAPALWDIFPLTPPFVFETPLEVLDFQFRCFSHNQIGDDPKKVLELQLEEVPEPEELKTRARSQLILSRRRAATKALAALETVVRQDEAEYARSQRVGTRPLYVTGESGTELEKGFTQTLKRLRAMLGK